MKFIFNNYARLTGTLRDKKWYEWKIFLDEPEDKLNLVKSVEYRLGRTFPNPIRVIEDRASRFALESSGWGEFTMLIIVHLMDGSEERMPYLLDFSKPWPAEEN